RRSEWPAGGACGGGLVFRPGAPAAGGAAQAHVARLAAEEGLSVLGWRDVPHDDNFCGAGARATMPRLAQLFVAAPAGDTGLALDRRAVCPRQRVGHQTGPYPGRPSGAAVGCKGMRTPPEVDAVFPDRS